MKHAMVLERCTATLWQASIKVMFKRAKSWPVSLLTLRSVVIAMFQKDMKCVRNILRILHEQNPKGDDAINRVIVAP